MSARMDDTLREAAQLLTGARNDAYGNPRDTYARAAGAFQAMTGREFAADDMVLAMLCVKLAREAKNHKRDNLVDLAAYASILQFCHDASGLPVSPAPGDL